MSPQRHASCVVASGPSAWELTNWRQRTIPTVVAFIAPLLLRPRGRYTLRMTTSPPRYVRPCRPTRATKPPVGSAWLHEPKLDGYRLQIVKSGRTVRLYTKNGYDWSNRLAALAEPAFGALQLHPR